MTGARPLVADRDVVILDQHRVAEPLLIIAGAESGKTNTLAHRAAHLIVKSADHRRILPMPSRAGRLGDDAPRRADRGQGARRQ